MGPGIAFCFAAGGRHVTLVGRSEQSIERGRLAIDGILADLGSEGLMSASQGSNTREALSFSTDVRTAVVGVDLVVESVAEDLRMKRELFGELDEICSRRVIITSNTSGLRISDISQVMRFPERSATTHFWQPPHLIPLVEIIQGERTSEETVQLLRRTLAEIGKEPAIVRKDVLGQLGVRLLAALTREAIWVVQQGIASPEDVDRAVKVGFGLRLPAYGPLEHLDMSGLDLIIAIQSYLYPDLCDSHTPLPLLADGIARGELGVKTGRGLYDWVERDAEELRRERDLFLMARMKDRSSAKKRLKDKTQ